MKIYQCSKCNVVLESPSIPNGGKCPSYPANVSGSHQWKPLGSVGTINYQCSKCNIMVKSDNKGLSGGKCPSYPVNVSGSHQWKKL